MAACGNSVCCFCSSRYWGISCPAVHSARPARRAPQRHVVGDRRKPRPDVTGQQYVTIAGVINGPTVNEFPVYWRMAVDVDQWPSMGELHQVVYSSKNPDNWKFAPPEAPAG